MKFRLLVSALAGVAVCATSVTAQVCQGDLSFRASRNHVGAALGVSNNATSFGGGMTHGSRQGWYEGASLGMLSYDNQGGHSVLVNGGLAYALPMQPKSQWQVCPGGTLSLGFGPNSTAGGVSAHVSTQTLSLGASVGTSLPLSKKVNLLPFGSAAFGSTRVALKVNGNSNSTTDSYLLLGAGAGFQLTPSLVLRPAFSLAAGADVIDDTSFSLGVTFALPH